MLDLRPYFNNIVPYHRVVVEGHFLSKSYDNFKGQIVVTSCQL